MTPHPTPPEGKSQLCHKLAKKLGCELDIDKRHRTVTIHLPDDFQIPGNPGLNIRVNNMESMADVWEATLADLRDLEEFGMEALS